MADNISHEAPAQNVTALPVMVPAKLIGRDAVLGQVYTRLRENQPVLIYGAAGMGKTAMAATLAAAYTEQPGGVLWLNVHKDSLEQLIVRVGRAYQVTEITSTEHPAGMIGAVASTLTQHKPLIVLDGELDEQATRIFVQRCVTNLPVLLVHQQAFGDDDWMKVELSALEAAHAVTLFKQTAGLPPDPDPDVDRLVQALRNVPLALVLAGGTVRTTKQAPSKYLETIAQIPGANSADPSLVALTAAFRSLNSALQGLLLMMGAMFRGEATPELLSKVGNAPEETVQQVMRILVNQHLLEQTERYGQPYYRLHPLTHKFAQTLAGEQRLKELRTKIRDALINFAQEYSTDANEEAYDKLAAMMDNFIAAAEWTVSQKDLDVPNQLSVALMQADDFVNGRGYVYEFLRLRRLASTSTTPFPASPEETSRTYDEVDLDEDEDFDDEDYDEDDLEDDIEYVDELDELDLEDDEDIEYDEDFDDDELDDEDDDILERTYIPEIPPAQAVDEDDDSIPEGDIAALRTALLRARESNNVERQITLLESLAEAQIEQSQENEAIATYNELLTLYEDRGDDDDLLHVLDTLSTLMVKTDNAQPAILHANRGIQLAQRLGDEDTEMHMHITLGDARQQLGESAAAEMSYGQALEIARTSGDKQNEAIILFKLGFAQLDNSDAEGASATWEQALPLFREQEKREYEGKVLGALGTAYGELGRWSEGVHFHTSALHIAREVKDKDEELLQLSNLAYAAAQAEDLGQAVLRYRQALHLAYQGDDRENIVSTIVDLAGLLAKSPRHLAIARLLIDDAAEREPNDRDVNSLRQRIVNEILAEEANGIPQKDVGGTAQEYAANAYRLLDE